MTDWEVVVYQHSPLVWRTAYRILGYSEDAADCFQEAFLAALVIWRRERVANWPALLRQLATRRALDRLRQRCAESRRNEPLPNLSDLPSQSPGPSRRLEDEELLAELRHALAQVPEQQAEVFCLRYFEGLEYEEIGKQLSMKSATARVLFHRARERLRELLAFLQFNPNTQ